VYERETNDNSVREIGDLDPPKRVHHLTLIFTILKSCIEKESRFSINFTLLTNQIKFTNIFYGHHLTGVGVLNLFTETLAQAYRIVSLQKVLRYPMYNDHI
jgi:hypothetical protein